MTALTALCTIYAEQQSFRVGWALCNKNTTRQAGVKSTRAVRDRLKWTRLCVLLLQHLPRNGVRTPWEASLGQFPYIQQCLATAASVTVYYTKKCITVFIFNSFFVCCIHTIHTLGQHTESICLGGAQRTFSPLCGLPCNLGSHLVKAVLFTPHIHKKGEMTKMI